VNEIQLIRSQLRAERERAGAVGQACAAADLEAFREASRDYLACVLGWFEERDGRLRERYEQRPRDDPERLAIEGILAGAGSSHEALERLGQGRWPEVARVLAGPWTVRRTAIEERLAANPRVADWRAIGGLTADTILEERRRYARVRQQAPAGTALPGP
jgi:hypothetical protein